MSEPSLNPPNPKFSIGTLLRTLLIGSRFAAPAAVYGLGTAVAMWCIFFFTLLPGASLPPIVTGIALLSCMAIGAGLAGRHFGKTLGWRVAVAAGWTTVKVNLLLIGMFIAKSPANITPGHTSPEAGMSGLHWSAVGNVLGFTFASVVIALVAGLVGSIGRPDRRAHEFDLTSATWLPRFALITSVVFIPLILIGGLVTSTGSGMSVKGWPASDGANMFLYPISFMTSHQSIFLEHSHRLFGTLAGVSTLVLTCWVTLRSPRRSIKIFAWTLLALVVVQGVLGGFRVTEGSAILAMLHGITGQISLGVSVALTSCLFLVNRPLCTGDIISDENKLKSLATGLVHTVLIQLAFGAAFRHLRIGGSPGAMHAMWAHMGFSLVALVMAILVGTFARSVGRERNDRALDRLGTGLVACVSLQMVIGILAFVFVLGGHSKSQTILQPDELASTQIAIPAYEVLTRTLHQANGALLLAGATAVLVIARFRLRREEAISMVVPANAAA